MSYQPDDYSPPASAGSIPTSSTTQSTTDAATDQAKQVKDQAVDTTKQVAGVAAEQVQTVASEAKAQTRNLAGEARQQLTDQASTQQNNVASWLFSLVEELEQMVDRTQNSGSGAQGSSTSGTATTLVRQASERARGAATWLQDHEPQDLLAETGRFARRRPGMFLGIALAGGIVAGRLTRGLTADSGSDSDQVRYPSAGTTGVTGARGLEDGSSYAGGYEPPTYGTGQSLAGSGPDLPAASGYATNGGYASTNGYPSEATSGYASGSTDGYASEGGYGETTAEYVGTVDDMDTAGDVDPIDALRATDRRYRDDSGRL